MSSQGFEVGPTILKIQVRVVLRGDIVKDDSGSFAVLTEQGLSASLMTAANVMDVISRPPGCAGQAAGAVSARAKLRSCSVPIFTRLGVGIVSRQVL